MSFFSAFFSRSKVALQRAKKDIALSSRQKLAEWRRLEFENVNLRLCAQYFAQMKVALGYAEPADHADKYGLDMETRRRLVDCSKGIDHDITKWNVLTDQEIGGSTTASVRMNSFQCPSDPSKTRYSVVFEGKLAPLQKNKKAQDPWYAPKGGKEDTQIEEVPGYAALLSHYHQPPLSMEPMSILVINVKTCGRPYFFNVIPECYFGLGDVYMSKIAAEEISEFEERKIGVHEFVQTSKGFSKYYQVSMDTEKIGNFSIGIQGTEGPFRLELEWIEARLKNYEEIEERIRKIKNAEANLPIQERESTKRVKWHQREQFDLEHDPVYREYVELERELEKEEEHRQGNRNFWPRKFDDVRRKANSDKGSDRE